jgi:sugar/nucleoside kinase (ribokinase family)
MTNRLDLRVLPTQRGSDFLSSGFVALDVIEGREGRISAAGGSCANVAAILAWFGWSSAIVARIGADLSGEAVCQDLKAFGVDLRHVRREDRVRTPIVLQRFVQDVDGSRRHRFSLVCPECGSWLPRFRSVVLEHIRNVIHQQAPKAFYFDRISPAIIQLASWAKQHDALVVFEPSSISENPIFRRAVDLCHILKYSEEQLGHIKDLAEARQPAVIVRTRGVDGLSVRWRDRWSDLSAYRSPRLVDAAGSGDWCTAGIIHVLAQSGAVNFNNVRNTEIERALLLGQALAAVNCGFEGARGIMYAVPREQLNRFLIGVVGGDINLPDDRHLIERPVPINVCRLCADDPQKSDRGAADRPATASVA